jgi:hypothetical protein
MTIPAGAGSSSAGSQQQTHVPDDDSELELPAATGNTAAGGAPSGDIAGGGPVSDAVADQAPTGVGSAERANAERDKGETGGVADTLDPVGTDDPSGI